MSIHYEVSPNKLTVPPSYAPRTRPLDTISTATLAAAIAATSSMSVADVQAVLTSLSSQLLLQLLGGNSVQVDGIGILTVSLRDRLPGPTEPLTADATLDIGFRADSTLREQVRAQATLERIDPAPQAPLLLALTKELGASLPQIAPGDILLLQGDRLSFHPLAADEGVFLVALSGAVFKIETTLDPGDKRLRFAIPPSIASTHYHLQVRARRPNSMSLRSTAWETELQFD